MSDYRATINSYVDALEFMNSVHDCVPILVYYYNNEKCYSFRSPRNFPYCKMSGFGVDNKPQSRQVENIYTMPFRLGELDTIIETRFVEFYTTSVCFHNLLDTDLLKKSGFLMNTLYNKKEIENFINGMRKSNV